MFYLMDAKQEVEYEEFKILNMLAIWFEAFPMWQCTKKVSLSQSVFGSQFLDQYEGHFE